VAKGAFFLFVDSDMVLAPEVVGECVAAHADPAAVGVVIPEESFGIGFWAECRRFERQFYVGVPWMEAARFFRRDTFERAGGYDEALVAGEDWDLSQRVGRLGELVRTVAPIRHDEGAPTLSSLVRKKSYYARAIASYASKADNAAHFARQAGALGRLGVYFRRPRRLLSHPILSMGMLLLKTCEFAGNVAALRARGK
jgi:arabinofuranan 3-O-arabinosyltransferase